MLNHSLHRKIIRRVALILHENATRVKTASTVRYQQQSDGYQVELSNCLRQAARVCESAKDHSVAEVKRALRAMRVQNPTDSMRDAVNGAYSILNVQAFSEGLVDVDIRS